MARGASSAPDSTSGGIQPAALTRTEKPHGFLRSSLRGTSPSKCTHSVSPCTRRLDQPVAVPCHCATISFPASSEQKRRHALPGRLERASRCSIIWEAPATCSFATERSLVCFSLSGCGDWVVAVAESSRRRCLSASSRSSRGSACKTAGSCTASLSGLTRLSIRPHSLAKGDELPPRPTGAPSAAPPTPPPAAEPPEE